MASITEKIRDAVAGIIDSGTHSSIAEISERVAKELGLNERLISYTHVEIRNYLNEPRFKRVPFEERILFLPQCLRNSEKCKAVMGEEGWECRKCGNCKIPVLTEKAREKGYSKVFISPGGSLVMKLIKKYKPKAVLGVACHEEVNLALKKLSMANIPSIGVLLLKDGCKDTDVNLNEVMDKMNLSVNS
ncbi:DUF116 domain-containing protein, partial [Candidatus Micrarchaeota archaeon]|nr:DUF116 domain-containing protein [Candidatus Micrarchaeota archaeon]